MSILTENVLSCFPFPACLVTFSREKRREKEDFLANYLRASLQTSFSAVSAAFFCPSTSPTWIFMFPLW